MRKILTLLSLILITASGVQAQSAADIAKKYVDAIGGAAKWKALKSSKMTVSLNQQGFDIPGYMIGDGPNRQRFQLEFNGMKMIQATDGTTAWGMNQFMGQTAPSKMDAAQTEDMNADEFLDSFIDYQKRGYTISLEGETDIEGQSTHKVKLTNKNNKDVIYYFDKDTGLMVAEQEVAQGQVIISYYSDYKEVEGLLMPMKIVSKSGGVTLFTVTISKVELNVETNDDMFAFPGN